MKGGIRERFAELRRMGIRTVMITGDNPLTAAAIAAEAGVDDFLAEATPEAKLALIRDYQAKGHLVAMTGDGTNDAPALAQADVAVAMNTGTQAAKEAGNMVDLDSNPTKLIAIVEIGKQMLMTRGALTTFSIANDVAKYFAIIPAAFVADLPGARRAQRDAARTRPTSAVLSAVIFNALIIVALIPLALRGVAYRAAPAPRAAAPQPARSTGSAASSLPFPCIKLIDLAPRRHRRAACMEVRPCSPRSVPRSSLLALFTVLTGRRLPARSSPASRRSLFPHQANGSLIVERDGSVVGSALIGQPFDDPRYFWGRPSATGPIAVQRRGLDAARTSGPTNPALARRGRGAHRRAARRRPGERRRSRSISSPPPAAGSIPHISPGGRAATRSRASRARAASPRPSVRALVERARRGAHARPPRRAARERAARSTSRSIGSSDRANA